MAALPATRAIRRLLCHLQNLRQYKLPVSLKVQVRIGLNQNWGNEK